MAEPGALIARSIWAVEVVPYPDLGTEAIRRMQSDADLRGRMGRRARVLAEIQSVPVVADAFVDAAKLAIEHSE